MTIDSGMVDSGTVDSGMAHVGRDAPEPIRRLERLALPRLALPHASLPRTTVPRFAPARSASPRTASPRAVLPRLASLGTALLGTNGAADGPAGHSREGRVERRLLHHTPTSNRLGHSWACQLPWARYLSWARPLSPWARASSRARATSRAAPQRSSVGWSSRSGAVLPGATCRDGGRRLDALCSSVCSWRPAGGLPAVTFW